MKKIRRKINHIILFLGKVIGSKLFEYLILIAILLGAFGVRLYKIGNPVADWHAWRQVDTVAVSRIYLEEGINLLYPRYYDISAIQTGYNNPNGLRFVEFPIFNVINVVAFKALPKISLEEWGRLISVICAVGSSFFLFLIGRYFLGKWGGLLAAFFYAFIPYNIYFTRVILPEPMAVFFTVASLWFFIVYIKNKSKLSLFFSAALFAIGMLLKPFVAFYFPIYLYLLVKKYGWKVFWTNVEIYIALDIALIPLLLWRAWVGTGNNIIGIPFSSWLFNGDGIRLRPAWWRWIFGERLGYLILGIWGTPFLVYGLMKKKNWPIILSSLGMFLYVIVVATGNVRHDYYQTQTIPAIALLLASGVVAIWNSEAFNIWMVRAFTAFAVVMMLGMGWYQIKGDYQVNHAEIITAGEEVDKVIPKNAKVIAPYNGDTTFLYFTHRFGWPIVDRSIEEMISMGADYYVSVNFDNDTNNLLAKYKAVEKNNSFVIIDLHQPLAASPKR